MLGYATTSLSVAIACLVVCLAILFTEGRKAIQGSVVDMASDALIFGFLGFTMAAQVMLLMCLHETPMTATRLVGLYFTGIMVFISAIPIGFDYGRDMLRNRYLPYVPGRLLDAALLVFALCYLAEIILLITR